ncbi:MAG: hypothetical protein ABF823_01820 [Acetobacter syzygii]|uniref:hypothetical protein n=1 Tax=Acetobacter syzygii TaxID=146476 RepID=UPI0039EB38DD
MEKKTRFPSPTLKAFVPWNAGQMVGAKRALKEKHVWTIRFWLGSEQRVRDRALFDLALDSKLRGCDLVSLRIGDIVTSGQVRHRAMVVQQKTRRLYNSKLQKQREKACERGWNIAVVV